jgi:hypothetical protein
MATCENVVAATYAFPPGPMPVADRRMTLTIQCHDSAEYSSSLRGVGAGKRRDGGLPRNFGLCENHRRLYEQIDSELVQEAWTPSHVGKPVALQ